MKKHAVLQLAYGQIDPELFPLRCSSIANVARALAIALDPDCDSYDVRDFSPAETCLGIVALLDSLRHDVDAYLHPGDYKIIPTRSDHATA